jgi:predicted CopG family antitoxin
MVKQLKITLDDNEYQQLVKAKGNLTWKDFVFQLLEFKQKMEQEGEFVPRDSLKEPYVDAARLLYKLGKMLSIEQEGISWNNDYQIAALLPLIVSGVDVPEDEMVELYVFITNIVLDFLKKRHGEDEMWWSLLEYLRIALIKLIKGDRRSALKAFKEACQALQVS